ncbi:MAG: L,D-transpeptidase ErfK/SrfK [Acidobacteriota bacterium]|jgi:lipoprotein-anchoring transpeptidase ErfK/SrfK|nr:L,D-transpeptidase ErfK/SrfK [Acidobacteriota bacterium]
MRRASILSLLSILLIARGLPAAGKTSGPLSMAASTQKKILVVRIGATDVKTYTIAVGLKSKPTPTGRFTVRHIVWNPGWVPPNEKWAKGKKPANPGDPKNPMKVVKIFFQEPDYYIHGTDDEDSLGGRASHGCIRMAESDVAELARYLMEQSGAKQSDAWYDKVISGGATADVKLPQPVSFVIGR